MFLQVSSPVTVYLDHPGIWLWIFIADLTHLKARLGWSPFVASSLIPSVAAGFLVGCHWTPHFFQKLWRELPELMKALRSSLG